MCAINEKSASPRVGQLRVAPGGVIVRLVERQNRPGEGPHYVIATLDGVRLEARAAATLATWPRRTEVLP